MIESSLSNPMYKEIHRNNNARPGEAVSAVQLFPVHDVSSGKPFNAQQAKGTYFDQIMAKTSDQRTADEKQYVMESVVSEAYGIHKTPHSQAFYGSIGQTAEHQLAVEKIYQFQQKNGIKFDGNANYYDRSEAIWARIQEIGLRQFHEEYTTTDQWNIKTWSMDSSDSNGSLDRQESLSSYEVRRLNYLRNQLMSPEMEQTLLETLNKQNLTSNPV